MSNLPSVYEEKTKRWVEDFILKYNICPFAKPVIEKKLIRYSSTESNDYEENVQFYLDELDLLQSSTAAQLSTSLIIFPKGASLFNEFLDFVAQCDFILEDLNLAGEFINITFHPSFKFEDTFDNERINYVNRSPYPMIHLIRSSEIEIATKSIKQGEDINKANDLLLTSLSDSDFENNVLSLLSVH